MEEVRRTSKMETAILGSIKGANLMATGSICGRMETGMKETL